MVRREDLEKREKVCMCMREREIVRERERERDCLGAVCELGKEASQLWLANLQLPSGEIDSVSSRWPRSVIVA